MRKVTQKAIIAFKEGSKLSIGNTIVKDGNFYLHGNKIATIENGILTVSDCGWRTNTTKERLNAILGAYGLGYISQKKFNWFYHDGNKATCWPGSLSLPTSENAVFNNIIDKAYAL